MFAHPASSEYMMASMFCGHIWLRRMIVGTYSHACESALLLRERTAEQQHLRSPQSLLRGRWYESARRERMPNFQQNTTTSRAASMSDIRI